jgi:tRNA(Ile)-lysidine synthase
MPVLETFNPGIRDLLVRNGKLLADDEAYLEAQTQMAWDDLADVDANDLAKGTSRGCVRLRLEPLHVLPVALCHRLFRVAARRMVGADVVLEARHIASIDKQLADGHTGTVLTLVGGLNTRLEYDALVFRTDVKTSVEASSAADPDGVLIAPEAGRLPSWQLPVPGVVELPEIGWQMCAWRIAGAPGNESADELPPAPDLPAFSFSDRSAELGRAESRVYLDAATIGETLTVRTWKPGDRFRPLGMLGEKKLQDYFADAKVPRDLRARLPLVFNAEHLVWVAGLRIDDRVRLTPTTQAVVALQLEPLTAP